MPTDLRAWTIKDAIELYNVNGWGRDFFTINEAGQFVKVVQDRTGLRVACPEEIAYRRGFIDRAAFTRLAEQAPVSDYRAYLLRVLEDRWSGLR